MITYTDDPDGLITQLISETKEGRITWKETPFGNNLYLIGRYKDSNKIVTFGVVTNPFDKLKTYAVRLEIPNQKNIHTQIYSDSICSSINKIQRIPNSYNQTVTLFKQLIITIHLVNTP